MAGEIVPILTSVIAVSLLSLVGILTLSMGRVKLNKVLFVLVAFAAGTLLGGAFFDLIPEAVEAGEHLAFQYIVIGIVIFFVTDKVIHWRSHHHFIKHGNENHVKPFAYLNLIGEGIHNFLDGIIIAAAYLAGFELGVVATIAIICHEIPQEIGDFGILVHGGFSVRKAISYNFIVALTAVAGAVAMFFAASAIPSITLPMISLAGGGFLYIALGSLLPELHRETSSWKILLQVIFLILGIALMFWVGMAFHHAH